MSDQVSHPHKTTSKITFLYIYRSRQIRLLQPEGTFFLNNTNERARESHWKRVVIPQPPRQPTNYPADVFNQLLRQKKCGDSPFSWNHICYKIRIGIFQKAIILAKYFNLPSTLHYQHDRRSTIRLRSIRSCHSKT